MSGMARLRPPEGRRRFVARLLCDTNTIAKVVQHLHTFDGFLYMVWSRKVEAVHTLRFVKLDALDVDDAY